MKFFYLFLFMGKKQDKPKKYSINLYQLKRIFEKKNPLYLNLIQIHILFMSLDCLTVIINLSKIKI